MLRTKSMVNRTLVAIVAIAIVIPLSAVSVWNSTQSLELIDNQNQNQKIVALASFGPLYEFTKEVGGDKVDVSLIVPKGVEPHDWEPTVQDLQKMQNADLIIINGIGFESWINDIGSINSNAMIVDTSDGISIIAKEEEQSDDHEDDTEAHHDNTLNDPHIWLDPISVKQQVDNIANALVTLDPPNKNYYVENANSFKNKLDSLDSKIREELSPCNKDFIAFHNAFSYFANQYGLRQHTILSTGDLQEEPTAKNLVNTIKLAKELNTKVIFSEEAVDARTSQVIADEIDGKVLILSPLEVVDFQKGYIERMEQNVQNLKEALCI
jgi:zinc transport system substrate-binding protein